MIATEVGVNNSFEADALNGPIRILVACHKPCWLPNDKLYVPVHVGAALRADDETQREDSAHEKDRSSEGAPGEIQKQSGLSSELVALAAMQRDDEGPNISEKNSHYCELTALYWGWKNLNADYVGLCHYRRFFRGSGEGKTLTTSEAQSLLKQADVVVPKQRNYVIESVGNHYSHTFDGAHLQLLRDILQRQCPNYVPAFDSHMQSKTAHLFNMAIMKCNVFDRYCSWLFPLLDEFDACFNYKECSAFQARVVGRMAELLLDPWLQTNEIAFIEHPTTVIGGQNWLKKGSSFLAAKFLGKKYQESF